jgi:hypothetical protein
MNRLSVLLFSFFCTSLSAQLQICQDSTLNRELIRTGLIHSPLTVDISNSFEANNLQKKVLQQKSIYKDIHINNWKHHGLGKASISNERTMSGDQT